MGRISVGARKGRFSVTVQTGPGNPGVKRPGRGLDYPPQTKAEVKERVELYIYSHSGPSWTVMGRNLPLLLRLEIKIYIYIYVYIYVYILTTVL